MTLFIVISLSIYFLAAGAEWAGHLMVDDQRPLYRLRHAAIVASLLILAMGVLVRIEVVPESEAQLLEQKASEDQVILAVEDKASPPSPSPKQPSPAQNTEPPIPNEPPGVNWYIHHYSSKYGVDPLLVQAIIRVESGFQAEARSRQGAKGLMQINEITAKHLGLSDPFDIEENIEGGTRYLKELLKRHYWDLHLALASYNAGPSTVERFNGIPPYPETRRYVWRVINEYRNLKNVAAAFRESSGSSPDKGKQRSFRTAEEKKPVRLSNDNEGREEVADYSGSQEPEKVDPLLIN